LPWKSVFEVGYVGNKADYLSNYNNSLGTLNLLPVGALFSCTGVWQNGNYNIQPCRPMANYQSVKIINHKMYSNYNSVSVLEQADRPLDRDGELHIQQGARHPR